VWLPLFIIMFPSLNSLEQNKAKQMGYHFQTNPQNVIARVLVIVTSKYMIYNVSTAINGIMNIIILIITYIWSYMEVSKNGGYPILIIQVIRRFLHWINGNSRILKWRYCTIFLAIFLGYILLHCPCIGIIYGRYLQWIGSWNGQWLYTND